MVKDHRFFVLFLVDDVQGNLFCEKIMQDPTILPHVKADLFDRGASCSNVVSLFTSASIQGHTTLLTGRYPNKHEVLAEGFWDVKNPADPMRINLMSISLNTIKQWNRRIAVKTWCEWVPDSTSFHVVDRGAKERFFKPSAYWRFAWMYLKVRLFGPKTYTTIRFWEQLILSNSKRYLKILNKKGMTTGVQITFSPSDNAAHLYGMVDAAGNITEGYKQSLQLLDKTYTLMVDGFDEKGRHVKGLKELGIFDKTLFVVCADHASRAYREEIPLVKHLRENWPLRFCSLLNAKGKAEPPKDETPAMRAGADFLLAEEGGIAAFYCKNPTSGRFEKWLPLACFEHYSPRGKEQLPLNFITQILALPHTDHAFFQVGPREVLIAGQRGRALMSVESDSPSAVTERYSYRVITGEDPLQYAHEPVIAAHLLDGNFHENREWLQYTARHRFPATPEVVFHYFMCPYAGNVVVVPEDPYNYFVKDDGLHKLYMHDRDNREEIIVPLVFTGPGIKQKNVIPCAKNVDVLPTILRWLGVPYAREDFDGVALEEIFEQS